METQTILVIGATGAQGGSVAKHLLSTGKFRVKALTRNPNSNKATWLKEAGAEVVQGNLNDLKSLETVMQGCDGVLGCGIYYSLWHTSSGCRTSGIIQPAFSSKSRAGDMGTPRMDRKRKPQRDFL